MEVDYIEPRVRLAEFGSTEEHVERAARAVRSPVNRCSIMIFCFGVRVSPRQGSESVACQFQIVVRRDLSVNRGHGKGQADSQQSQTHSNSLFGG